MALAEQGDYEPTWTLGDRLAKARRHAGLEQKELAEQLGVSPAAVGKWERDDGRPRDLLGVVEQWAALTGVSAAWLLGFRTGSFAPRHLALVPPLHTSVSRFPLPADW